MRQCWSPEIDHVKPEVWVHINIGALVVDTAAVRRILMRMEATVWAFPDDWHAPWSCQSKYSMSPAQIRNSEDQCAIRCAIQFEVIRYYWVHKMKRNISTLYIWKTSSALTNIFANESYIWNCTSLWCLPNPLRLHKMKRNILTLFKWKTNCVLTNIFARESYIWNCTSLWCLPNPQSNIWESLDYINYQIARKEKHTLNHLLEP